jgi:transglutaminase-like putative cysteine protease
MEKVNTMESQGRFREAAGLLTATLEKEPLAAADRKGLEFERDRLDRIRKDFPYSEEELFEEVQRAVKDLSRQEFNRWVREDRFDSREIDGQRRFMASSVSNLFFRYPELAPRRTPPKDTAALDTARLESCVAIRKAALEANNPYVLPRRFEVTMTVSAHADVAPPGETVRAWIPVPREFRHQRDFQFLTSSPALKHLDPVTSPVRAAFLEQPAVAGKTSLFKVEYAYTAYGVSFHIDPARVVGCDTNDPALKPFLSEAPHVVFTPEIRALSSRIAGTEANPCVKAKKFYDWIAANIKYSYATEYSTIRNLSAYCLSKGYGDCGQEALLFITLCRLNGIPARWQSGWNLFPGDRTIHDWSEIYLAPYGWVPVDPYMGIYATRYATSLSPSQKEIVRDFYFGGLDPYRMAANSDHNQELNPSKKSMRSDNVDFQRGELEWGTHNIYFDQSAFNLRLKEIPLAPDNPQ